MGFAAYGGALHGLDFRRVITAFRAQITALANGAQGKALARLFLRISSRRPMKSSASTPSTIVVKIAFRKSVRGSIEPLCAARVDFLQHSDGRRRLRSAVRSGACETGAEQQLFVLL